jgi:GNAT superfamily N-acetyltransferase
MAASALAWRSMTEADISSVVTVARLSFPDHFESRACFENRLALCPTMSFVLADAEDTVRGYLFAYPWKGQTAPPLNTLIEAIPADADRIYLHDLALDPAVRGGRHTRAIVERLIDQARAEGWTTMALVAVNDATAFWQRMGFQPVTSPALAAKLASYGDDARYMLRTL